jgi:hypothetical protein
MEKKQLHESGLNVIQNPDGSFAFEWDPNDERWKWLNDLTDDQIKGIIEETIDKKILLETVTGEFERYLS